MASTIQIKNSNTAGNSPSSLTQGELAINVNDGNLFYGDGSSVKQDFVLGSVSASGGFTGSIDASGIDGTIDISDQTNLAGGTNLTLSGDTMNLDANISLTSITASGDISASGDIIANNATITTQLTAAGINYPTTDGDNGDVLITDGAGNLSFTRTTVYANVKNVHGSELVKGMPVHVTGASGNTSEVVAASASNAATMPAHFILNETLADDAEGLAIATGFINGVNTGDFNEGDTIYVAADGGYTNVKPTGSNLIQNLGIVDKVHASNGSGFVLGAGRSNDVPNITSGYAWVGNSDQVATAVATSSFVVDNSNTASYVAAANINGTIDISDQTNLSGGTNLTLSGDTMNLDADINLTSITASSDISSSGTITGNSIVGTLSTATQTNITQVGTLDSLTLGGDLDMDGNTLSMNNGEIDSAISIQSLLFKGNTDSDLIISSDGNITFKLDDDNDETGQSFKFQNDDTEIANLDESGNLQLDGNITASGDISASGDINCDNLTVATSITSVGDDVIIGDDLVLGSPAAKLRFSGSSGGGNEAIQYYDSNGDIRNVVMFTGTNTFSIMNRAPDGKVEIRANSSTAGSGGEVTVATFEDDLISLDVAQKRQLFVSSTTDGDANGDYIKLGSTATTAGKIYYYNSSGNWVETDADAESSSTGLIAVAMANYSSKGMLLKGMVTLDHDPGTVGDILYLRAGTSGEATSTAPSGTNDIVRVIGYCLDSSNRQIYFNPSNDFIKHT